MTTVYAEENNTSTKSPEALENGAVTEPLLDWHDSLRISGDWPKDVVLSADTQYQYWERIKHDVVNADGGSATETIEEIWAAANHDNWDTEFISLCLQYAQIPNEHVPHEIDSENCIDVFKDEQFKLFREKSDYVPRMGDLVVLDSDNDGKADIVGILNAVDEQNITVITGDEKEYINEATYAMDDKGILGYASINEAYEKSLLAEATETESVPEAADSEQKIEVDVAEQYKADSNVTGIANSTLEDGKTYIIYGYSYNDGKCYALGESGQTEEVLFSGNKITAPGSKAVKWTYNEQQKSFCNSAGNYLNSTTWYGAMTTGDLPQQFTTVSAQGWRIGTTLSKEQGGYEAYFTFYNNAIVLGNADYSSFYFARVDNQTEPDPPAPPTPPVTPDSNLKIRKYVDRLEATDQYDLNLTVDGVYAADGKNKADIIYVVDTTGSMEYSMDGQDRYSKERWNSILASAEYMTNLLKSNPAADIRYSVIFFNEDAKVGAEWTSDTDVIMRSLHTYDDRLGGGTNYEAACSQLVDSSLVKQMRNDAEHVVVFLSDGEPNMYFGDNGYAVHDSSPDNKLAIEKAKAMLSYLDGVNMFYSVGVGSDILEQSKLEELSSGLKDEGVKVGYAHCKNTDQIKKAFDEIIRSIIKIKYDHVTITDTLSKYAELVDGTKLRITVKIKKDNKSGLQKEIKKKERSLFYKLQKSISVQN